LKNQQGLRASQRFNLRWGPAACDGGGVHRRLEFESRDARETTSQESFLPPFKFFRHFSSLRPANLFCGAKRLAEAVRPFAALRLF
jgi:hypothetical protein